MKPRIAVLAAGETESGITVHYVAEGVDTGDVIAQFRCPAKPSDTPDTIAARIHTLKQRHLPAVVQQLTGKRIEGS